MIYKDFIKLMVFSVFSLIGITGINLVDNLIWKIIILVAGLVATMGITFFKSKSKPLVFFQIVIVFTFMIYLDIDTIINVLSAIITIIIGALGAYWGYKVVNSLVESA